MLLHRQINSCFSILVILLLSQGAFAQWVKIHRGEGNFAAEAVRDLHLYDASNGYVATSGALYYTRSEGAPHIRLSYNGMDADVKFAFRATQVYASSKSKIVVAGYYGAEPMILYSEDEGSNWKLSYYEIPEGNEFSVGVGTMQFLTTEIGLVTTKNGILRTTDGGKSWNYTLKKRDSHFDHLFFFNSTHGWVNADDGLYKSTDAGQNWALVSSKKSYGFHFINETIGYLSGKEEEGTFKTSNGGVSWQKVSTHQPLAPRKILFLNDSIGFCSTIDDYLYKTSSGGKYWERMSTAYANAANFRFIKRLENAVYTGGDRFTILRTNNDGGPIEPHLDFSIDQSTICTMGRVSLINNSPTYHKTEWWLNGKLLTDSFNASYEMVSNRRDTITMVLLYNGQQFQQTQYVSIPELSPPNLSVQSGEDIYCPLQSYSVLLSNTTANSTYKLHMNGRLMNTQNGNGGNLRFTGSFGSLQDSILVEVVGSNGGLCATQEVKENFWVVRRIYERNLQMSATKDTICNSVPTEITIHNSKVGFNYYYDTIFQKPVAGNGGAIKVRFQQNSFPTGEEDSIGVRVIPVTIKIQESVRGCYLEYSNTKVDLTARFARAAIGSEPPHQFVGLRQPFSYSSLNVHKSLWYSDSAGIINNFDTTHNAALLSFASPGVKNLIYKVETKEGCVAAAAAIVEVISDSSIADAIPPSLCSVDTFQLPYNLKVREIEFDRYGNRYLSSTVTTLRGDGYKRQSGFVVRKIKPDGSTAWLVNKIIDLPRYENPYILAERIIVDRKENVYVFGYASERNLFPQKPANADVTNSPATARVFLMKINRAGNIVWLRTLQNDHPGLTMGTGTGTGALFLGKNDDLFIVINDHAGRKYSFANTSIDIEGNGWQTIFLHIDQDFNLLDYRRYDGLQSGLQSNWRNSGVLVQDKLERGLWTSNGEIATLITKPYINVSNETFDDTPYGINGHKPMNALAFYDTSAKKITRLLPFYSMNGTTLEDYIPRVYCLDSDGNYYGVECKVYSYWAKVGEEPYLREIRESFLIKYDNNGRILWRKRMTQFAPEGISLVNNKLFLWGATHITVIPDLPYQHYEAGVTSFENSPHDIIGKRGLGGTDMVGMFVSLDGTVEHLSVLGSHYDDLAGRAKVDNLGNCWVTGTTRNTKLGNVNIGSVYTSFVAAFNPSGTCNYQQPSSERYLELQANTLPANCIDSSFTLKWSSNLTGPASLSFSINDGENFIPHPGKIEISKDSVQFFIDELPTQLSESSGRILVKMQHDESGIEDQLYVVLESLPPPLLSVDSLSMCFFEEVSLKISPKTGHRFVWQDNDSTSLQRTLTMENYTLLRATHISPGGCLRNSLVHVDWKGLGLLPVIDTFELKYNNRLTSTLDFPHGRHYWYRDGILLPDSGRVVEQPLPGTYSLRLRDYNYGGCYSRYSNLVVIKGTVTSLEEIDPAELGYILFPNPLLAGNLSVKFHIEESSSVLWQISDIHGRIVFQQNWGNHFRGSYRKQVPSLANILRKGTYFCRLILNNKSQSVKTLIIP